MNSIRLFLWMMVAAMTLQGFLHADEYGTAATLFGGMSLTMAIWRESIGAFFNREPPYTLIPRALVISALHTTNQHAGLHRVPVLQQALQMEQTIWTSFHSEDLQWLLAHTQLLGAVRADPDAQGLWNIWDTRYRAAQQRLTEAKADLCSAVSRLLMPTACTMYSSRATMASLRLHTAGTALSTWNRVLEGGQELQLTDIAGWWSATQLDTLDLSTLGNQTARMYDITDVRDDRIRSATMHIHTLVTNATTNPWLQRLTESLLTGHVWAACLEHVRGRESRIRDLMIHAGIQELFRAYDTALNASLRVTQNSGEAARVRIWFDELAKYSWWLGEDVPELVRRCLRQEGGECARVGPTEIQALTAKMNERLRILDDWSRRVFIGLWNALPAVAFLFFVELILVCVHVRIKIPGSNRDERAIAGKTSDDARRIRDRVKPILQEEISERVDPRD